MAVDVSIEIVIRSPRGMVAEFSTNPDNAPMWYVNIKEVQWQTPPPLKIGSKIAFVAQFLGRRLAYTFEIIDHQPGRRLVMSTKEGPFPMETTYIWEDNEDGGTKMRLHNRGLPTGFSRFVSPFLAMGMRRANKKDLLQLKEILEQMPDGGR